MSFVHPERLALLLLAVALVAGYVAMHLRRRRNAARFANPALLPLLAPSRPGAWRHVVAAVFLAVVVVATVGAAQPTVPGQQEREAATIVVAVDVSDSMGATDVRPSRIAAATDAARGFVADLPSTFDVALVTAGASPIVVVPPTTDHRRVIQALGELDLSPGTALGEAIFTALSAIPLPSATTPENEDEPRAARIVLLSDGVTTTGRPDEEAVAAAKLAKVPVSTIAFGTDEATVESQGLLVDVPVDATALRAIAEGTGGRFFEAASAGELRSIYDQLEAEVTTVAADRDVAEWFAGAAIILLLLGTTVSMLTTGRVLAA